MNKEKLSVNREYKRLLSLLLPLFSFLIFVGCQDPVSSPANLAAPPEEKGSFTLNLSSNARTILPAAPGLNDFDKYNLAFTPTSGGSAVNSDYTNASPATPISISLEPGTYKLVVKAYLSGDKLAAQGTLNGIVIKPGENTSASVTLNAILSGGEGTFTWNITLPNDVTLATMIIAGGEVVDLSMSASGSKSLPSGLYNLTFNLKKTDGQTVVWKELLYVYQNLESRHPFQFTNAHFSSQKYNVTYEFNDGIPGPGDYEQSVLHGGTVNPGNPTRVSHTFVGWYTDEGLTQPFAFGSAVTANLTLYAKWYKIVAFNDLSANGVTGSETTTLLTLTFDQDIPGLAAGDITLNAGSTGAARGDLTRTGTGVYQLGVSDIITYGDVTVIVSKAGYAIDPPSKSVGVKYNAPPDGVTFTSLTANGNEKNTVTTILTLTFSKVIPGLTISDITLDDPESTGATMGVLSGSGPTYTLTVPGITADGEVTVTVTKSGYSISPASKNVQVNRGYVAVTLTQDGVEDAKTTTKITIKFDKDVPGFILDTIYTSNYVTMVPSSWKLARKNDREYDLLIYLTSVGVNGYITIIPTKTGYTFNPSQPYVYVYYYSPDIAVSFSDLTADGSDGLNPATTTKLTLHFDKDIIGLSAGDIDLVDEDNTGAEISALTRKSTGIYELSLSGISKSGNVSISVTKDGYAISPVENSVVYVYYYAPPLVSIAGLNITFAQITDSAPSIASEITLYRTGGINRPTSATFSVANPTQYGGANNITWYINGTAVKGASLTVHSMHYNYYSVGEHFLTLEVVRNGRTYSKRVTFNIAN